MKNRIKMIGRAMLFIFIFLFFLNLGSLEFLKFEAMLTLQSRAGAGTLYFLGRAAELTYSAKVDDRTFAVWERK